MTRWIHVRLPPIGEKEAGLLVDVLEAILGALWDAHGDALAESVATSGDLVPFKASRDEPTDPKATDDILF
jgi:hypothetical protein